MKKNEQNSKLNHPKAIYIWTLVAAIILFVLGQLLFVKTFKFLEPQIDGIIFQITEHNTTLKTSFLFSLTLSLIPVSIVLCWRLGTITSFNKKIISIFLVLIFITLGVFARHQGVKMYFTNVVRPTLLRDGKTNIIYPIDPVNFVYHIFLGLLIGCVLSYILFKKRQK